jgi:hypothetical protein
MPAGSVEADVEEGEATFKLNGFQIDDYGNVVNALSGGKEIATAKLTLRIDWHRVKRRHDVRNPNPPSAFAQSTPFATHEAFTGASLSWSAIETLNGVTSHIIGQRSDAADFAIVARERNGVFFGRDDEPDD